VFLGSSQTLCLWGQAKLFGLLPDVFGASCSVCSQEAEKICSPLELRGKPSASVSGGEPNECFLDVTSLLPPVQNNLRMLQKLSKLVYSEGVLTSYSPMRFPHAKAQSPQRCVV